MVRSVKNNHHHHQEEEYDDEEFVSRPTDCSSHKGGRRNDQKASLHRSKHSETEQRRRSKINERFQILRDIIPENDQKKDRASFLLEVIQYIQFLQEKLQVYEGGWSPELNKLMPWRGNCGADNFADQSHHPLKNGSVDEGNIVLTQALLTDPHNLIERIMNGPTAFKTIDHVDVSLHQNTYEHKPTHTHGSFPDVDLLASQFRPQTWNAVPGSSDGNIKSCAPSVLEESSISNAYSKGLLNNLTHALGSSGVDLSQASISVQLDIRNGTSSGATSTSYGIKDHEYLSHGNQAMTHCSARRGDDVSVQERKRPRTEKISN